MHSRLAAVPVLGIWLVTNGCQPGDAPIHSTFLVRDSAGIEIVESTAPEWTGDAWRLSDTPSLVIGRMEGDERYLFGRVAGAMVLRDGRIAVLDGQSALIQVYSPEGEHIEDWGGQGEGPTGDEEGPSSMTEFFVFGGDGRHPGVVEMHRNLRVFQIGAEFILGAVRDDLGVDYVHMYRIEKVRRADLELRDGWLGTMRREGGRSALLLKAAVSLTLAMGIPQPVAAQDAPYRMGWVTPEIVCRAGPSYSTDATSCQAATGGTLKSSRRQPSVAVDLVATLAGVSDEDKAPLVHALGALEACAATMRSRPGPESDGGVGGVIPLR
ncbi:hypothetical protein [Candidatus Palauibacter sp.]|uniref:hypothetical protein n=1 Tax=Candidatus Palauibacter sp. TaxID=3101350 RepID=UPI003AF23782